MPRPDDFEIVDESKEPGRSSNQMLAWLAAVLILVLFGCAVGIAFARVSGRLRETTPAATRPQADATPAAAAVAGPGTPTAPVATATPARLTPTATITPTPTPTITPTCVVAVDPALVELQPVARLGCALAPADVVWAAYEPFQHGAMLWRSDTDAAYAFLNDGRWQRIDARWDGQPPPDRGVPPAGLYVPARGFGYVWATSDELFNTLGWALAAEKGFCAQVQEFSRGFIVRSVGVPSCTADNLYNQATAADWQPVLLIAADNDIWSAGTDEPVAPPAAGANTTRPQDQGLVVAVAPTQPITLDGNLSDWPGGWQTIPYVVYDAGAFSGGPDLSARFQTLYSDQGLLVAVRVQDDLYRPGSNGTDQWQGDGIEIQFDRELSVDYTNQEANDDDVQLGVAFDPGLTQLRGYRWLPFDQEGPLTVPGRVSAIGTPSAYAGYNAEFLLPWDWFGLAASQLGPDAAFGFNIAINDNDGDVPAQQTVLSFSPRRRTHDDPTQWATLVLNP